MTRRKRSRKTGPLASSGKDTRRVRDERQAANQKKQRGKGGKAGSRQQSAGAVTSNQGHQTGSHDPRVGSKKPLTLIQPGQTVAAKKPKVDHSLLNTPLPDDMKGIQTQLLALEGDDAFMKQLEIVDDGGILPPSEHTLFEQKLQRYEQLLEQAEALDEEDDPMASLLEGGAAFKDDWS